MTGDFKALSFPKNGILYKYNLLAFLMLYTYCKGKYANMLAGEQTCKKKYFIIIAYTVI